MSERDRLAKDLHQAFCVPLGEVPPDWEPDKHGEHLPHRPFYERSADRLIALGWTRLDAQPERVWPDGCRTGTDTTEAEHAEYDRIVAIAKAYREDAG